MTFQQLHQQKKPYNRECVGCGERKPVWAISFMNI